MDERPVFLLLLPSAADDRRALAGEVRATSGRSLQAPASDLLAQVGACVAGLFPEAQVEDLGTPAVQILALTVDRDAALYVGPLLRARLPHLRVEADCLVYALGGQT